MIQALQETQTRWLNRWKNRATTHADSIDMESEGRRSNVGRSYPINRILMLPGGSVVELEMGAAEAALRRQDAQTSPPR